MLNQDWRALHNGRMIPSEEGGYCDQPSIVRARDGSWVCTMTTGKGGEGARGQYVSITRSSDQGRTWTEPISLEGTEWESAYSSLAMAPSGRIYCFYCYNLEQVDIRKANLPRYDMGGAYCYRYSEDCGVTWSRRHVVPIREFAIDREPYEERYRSFEGKKLHFFWNVSRVFFEGDTFYSVVIKFQSEGGDILHRSEGTLLRCRDLDKHPDGGEWETLPDGEAGLRTPPGGGRVAEEQSFVRLTDGTLFATYRTIDGHPACALSRDDGHTFEEPRYMAFADGRLMKHNRAATFIWPLGAGKYLYWFNNHGLNDYACRNPIWCSLGSEVMTDQGLTLSFSEPEILLYHPSEHVRISYPDLLWDGQWFVTETQKVEARIHPIDDAFLHKLTADELAVTDVPLASGQDGGVVVLPDMPFSHGTHAAGDDQRALDVPGYTFSLRVKSAEAGEQLLSTRTPDGGVDIAVDEQGHACVWLGDVMAECSMTGSIALNDGQAHHLALVIDCRANVMYFVVDGRMDDGGEQKRSGWRWLNRSIVEVPGGTARCGAAVERAALYGRPLMTKEAVSLGNQG